MANIQHCDLLLMLRLGRLSFIRAARPHAAPAQHTGNFIVRNYRLRSGIARIRSHFQTVTRDELQFAC